METLSIVADICGILGFIISLFAINGVIKINKQINNSNNPISQTAIGSRNKQKISKK